MTDIPFPDLPEPENPGELPPVVIPPTEEPLDYQTIKISGGDENVYAAGRSPMWDGTPLDRHLLQEQHDEEPNPPVPGTRQLQLICTYCGRPMTFGPGDAPHACEEQLRRYFPAGRLLKLGDDKWGLVLETTDEGSIAYYTIPQGVFVEERLKDLNDKVQ